MDMEMRLRSIQDSRQIEVERIRRVSDARQGARATHATGARRSTLSRALAAIHAIPAARRGASSVTQKAGGADVRQSF